MGGLRAPLGLAFRAFSVMDRWGRLDEIAVVVVVMVMVATGLGFHRTVGTKRLGLRHILEGSEDVRVDELLGAYELRVDPLFPPAPRLFVLEETLEYLLREVAELGEVDLAILAHPVPVVPYLGRRAAGEEAVATHPLVSPVGSPALMLHRVGIVPTDPVPVEVECAVADRHFDYGRM